MAFVYHMQIACQTLFARHAVDNFESEANNRDMPPIKRPPRKRLRHFLRDWRLYRKMTLDQSSEKIGVDHSTLQRIEVGDSPYTQDHLESLAVVYDCSVDDLIRRNPKAAVTAADLARQIADAPDDLQRQAAAILSALLKTSH